MSTPQHSLLYKAIALILRLRLGYLLRKTEDHRILAAVFLFSAGAAALGTITVAAYLIDLPLLFPPLGPSAFILFYVPMSASASPRNVVLSHTLGLCMGLLSLYFLILIFPEANLMNPLVMNGYRAAAIALAMGLISVVMAARGIAHPPAAATALIAAMGYLVNPVQIIGFICAVLLLVTEAIIFNRIIGGLPYPLWEMRPEVAIKYGSLAGIPEKDTSFWRKMAAKTFKCRGPTQKSMPPDP
jgi:CBS-domain-containing membrane protein